MVAGYHLSALFFCFVVSTANILNFNWKSLSVIWYCLFFLHFPPHPPHQLSFKYIQIWRKCSRNPKCCWRLFVQGQTMTVPFLGPWIKWRNYLRHWRRQEILNSDRCSSFYKQKFLLPVEILLFLLVLFLWSILTKSRSPEGYHTPTFCYRSHHLCSL